MSFNQKVVCNHEQRERLGKAHGISKTLRRINHEQDFKEDQFVPSCIQTNIQSGKILKKAFPRTQDKVTQTVGFPILTSEGASVHGFLLKPTRMSGFTEPTPRVHHSRTHKDPATRRQTRHGRENHGTHFAPENHKVERNSSWIASEREPIKQGPKTTIGHESSSKSESQACIKKHPLLLCSHTNAPGINNYLIATSHEIHIL